MRRVRGATSLLRRRSPWRGLSISTAAAHEAALAWLQGAAVAAPAALPASALAAYVASPAAAASRVVLLDCASPEAFARARVPGALRFVGAAEQAFFKDPRFASRLLGAREAEGVAAANGVVAASRVVAYDAGSVMNAGYVAWSLRHFGLAHATLLDGGFAGYVEAGGRVAARGAAAASAAAERAALAPEAERFVAREGSRLVAHAMEVAAAAEALRGGGGGGGSGGGKGVQLLDTRTAGEFAGTDLRGNARGGRPPGAVNVPHGQMLRADGSLKPPAELRALFEAAGLDLARPVIAYCQLGFRGALGCLALAHAGVDEARIANYDASMREWLNGDEGEFAVEAGPPPAR